MGLAPYGEPKYRANDSRTPRRPQGRRQLPARPRLFRLLHRPDHDQRPVRRAVRRQAARSVGTTATASHGSRRLGAAGDRGDRAAADAQPCERAADRKIFAWPAASRSIASPTARSCASSFRNIWVQPAAGDAGGAVGAALAAYHQFAGEPRPAPAIDAMAGGYLGPSFSQSEIEQRLRQAGAAFATLADDVAHSEHGQGAGRGEGSRLVPGPDGVRPARAGRALHSR